MWKYQKHSLTELSSRQRFHKLHSYGGIESSYGHGCVLIMLAQWEMQYCTLLHRVSCSIDFWKWTRRCCIVTPLTLDSKRIRWSGWIPNFDQVWFLSILRSVPSAMMWSWVQEAGQLALLWSVSGRQEMCRPLGTARSFLEMSLEHVLVQLQSLIM